ncbi:mannosyltransferase family protein [Kitasatospora sp. NPDC088391]|uniref:mannosyltransferase family protein n=1 Tax=Kitasatospora sp. NPDC088391 TaxID=3364074 RepID=UPI0037F59C2C
MPPTTPAALPHPRSTRPAAPAPGPRAPLPLRAWHAAGPALGVYAGALALHLWLLDALARPGTPLTDRLTAWDGKHFLEIAADGYPTAFSHDAAGALTGNNLAFFPLYPMLVRLVHGLTGLEPALASVVTAQLATLAALVLVHRLVEGLYSRTAATAALVLLAAAQPMSLVFFMGYSESLFLALAAGTLLAAHRRAWTSAGLCAFLAGLTRPAGVAVVAALAVAALLELRRERRWSAPPLLATALACTGTPLYLCWVGARLGTADAWFTVQGAGWGTRWDWGTSLWTFLTGALARGDGWVPVSVALLVPAHLLALGLAARRTTWPPLLVYGALVVVLTLGQSNYYHSKPRLLAPALIVLVPIALALARARTSTRIAVLAAAALFGCWYGAHLLAVWPYAI